MFTLFTSLFLKFGVAQKTASILGKVVGILLVVGIVGGTLFAIWKYDHDRTVALADLSKQVGSLQTEVKKTREANATLNGSVTRLQRDVDRHEADVKALKAGDAIRDARVARLTKKTPAKKQEELNNRNNGKDAALLERYNAQSICQAQHFARAGGTCIDGAWVPDSVRN